MTDVELRNENGTIVGYDSDGNKVPVSFEDLATESLGTKAQSGDYHWPAEYDGADADARLSAAISAAEAGDTIFLEDASYDSDLTISKRLRLVGTGGLSGGAPGDGTFFTGMTLTLSDRVKLVGIGANSNVTIAVNATLCVITESAINGNCSVDIGADNCRYVNNHGGDVTFASGTSGGLVDACTAATTTDNGTNTVGDIG